MTDPAAAPALPYRVAAWLRRYRPAPEVAALCCVVLLLAALLPFAGSPRGEALDLDAEPAAALRLRVVDLTPFVANRRWGKSIAEGRAERDKRQSREEASRAPPEEPRVAEPSPAQALQAIGFVGVVINKKERAVLLTLPDGQVVRRVAGDALADGRVLSRVSEGRLGVGASVGRAADADVVPAAATVSVGRRESSLATARRDMRSR